jgi:queuine tRNA-ribosyltransferase
MSGVEVVTLKSGVQAIRDCASGQIMHCGTGPAIESRAIYVDPSRLEARLREPGEDRLVIFDVGLGAASNALAAWRVSESLPLSARKLELVSFDHDLEPLKLALQPEHAEAFGLSQDNAAAHAAAQALLAGGRHETARTVWRLAFGDLLESLANASAGSCDIVYWDMYSREVSPALWTVATFRSLWRACRAGATMHTYSAATSTRSGLLLAGFAVGIGDRTGDKEQTTIAAMDARDLEAPLDARWLTRLSRSSAAFPSDVPADAEGTAAAFAQIRAMPQFA